MIQIITDFIHININYIIVGFIFIVLILLPLVSIRIKRILSFYGTKQFDIKSFYNHDTTTKNQYFVFRIYNKSIYDLRLSGFGYTYKGEMIDLETFYKTQEQMLGTHQITIQPRDYLTLKFPFDVLYDHILEVNQNTYTMSKISAFVIDSMGMTSFVSMPKIKKQMAKALKTNKKLLNEKQKQDKKIQRKLKKTERLNALNHQLNTEKNAFKKFLLHIKKFF